jgi:hypothetical protein
LIIVAISPAITLAAGIPDKIVPCNGVDCTVCNIASLAQNVLNMAVYLAVFLAAILFAWAGVKMVTARDNAGQRSDAKKVFFNVMVGLVGILAAWLIIDTIMFTFTGSHLWSQLC